VDTDAGGLEPHPGPSAELVAAEKAVERRLAGKPRQIDRRDTATTGRLLPGFVRADDLARTGHGLNPDELDPLDVTDHRHLHDVTLTDASALALKG